MMWDEYQRETLGISGIERFGLHGLVVFTRYSGKEKTLSDGVRLHKGTLYGDIELQYTRDSQEPLMTSGALLLLDFLRGLENIIHSSQNQRLPRDLVALRGLSHLASLRFIKNLGFEVESPTLKEQFLGTIAALMYASPENMLSWKTARRKWNKIQVAWISLNRLKQQEEQISNLYADLQARESRLSHR